MSTPIEHPCPGDCGRSRPPGRVACVGCWHRLPNGLRRALRATLERDGRGSTKHLRAVADCLHWYRDNNPSAP